MKLGVAIFRYKGAQSPPPSQRTREEALALAQKAIVVAGQDFARAVELGDQGSSGNIGWIQRGILEPTVEHAVFSLENGAFTPEPVDTPRGFWVAKRLR
jgi:parvulin-like peptidyl-prolyl isomerase